MSNVCHLFHLLPPALPPPYYQSIYLQSSLLATAALEKLDSTCDRQFDDYLDCVDFDFDSTSFELMNSCTKNVAWL